MVFNNFFDCSNIIIADNTKIQRYTAHYAEFIVAQQKRSRRADLVGRAMRLIGVASIIR